MRQYLQKRLEKLQKEQDAGQRNLEQLRQSQAQLEGALHRINGALIVIRETLAQPIELAPTPPEIVEPCCQPNPPVPEGL